jgi:hypothetical protein
MKKKRVIFDTNIWISFLISKDLIQIDRYIYSEKITLLFSTELINEFLTVANRPKFRKFFSKTDLEALINLLYDFGEIIQVKSNILLCRDAKDNFLLNLAIDGKADFLITGDKDLLDLKSISNTKILTIRQFLYLEI